MQIVVHVLFARTYLRSLSEAIGFIRFG